ncbi:MAG TPA: hypothetical protein VMT25_05975 [Thermoanaerobaculia bacterium]|nr:hypothetical protein [Thermoanaerobaculia bacterium]
MNRTFRCVLLAAACGAATARAQSTTGPTVSDRSQAPGRLSSNPLIAEADRMYLRRQEGRVGARASTGPINSAISGYEAAASRDPDSVEARWKLMRAFYFKGNFTGLDEESQKAVFEKAKRVGDEAVGILEKSVDDKGVKGILEYGPEALAGALKDRSDSAPTYFWAAACWGQWAITQGKIEAVRMGAADKIRSYGLTVIGIDPEFEDGGGYRVVGRLNDQAPWIPFITGWVSRDEALKYLRLAMKVSPRNFSNRHFLADALHHGGDAKDQAEAIALEEALVADAPSPQRLVEELSMQEMARQNLEAWKKAS